MKYSIKETTADLLLVMAIEDMAKQDKISIAKARHKLITSKTYNSLYNFDTALWKEWPDYIRAYYDKIK